MFRTPVIIPPSPDKIGHQDRVLLLGSCFAENIGEKLTEYKFPVCNNPFGVLYNPVSINQSLEILLNNTSFTEKDLIFHSGLWHSFYHHSRFSAPEPSECLSRINDGIRKARLFLNNTRFLFLSWGTARVYRFRETGMTVSNCHKIPEKAFERVLLRPEEMVSSTARVIGRLMESFPSLKVIFTVSPVRHMRDGATGNTESKAILFVTVHELIRRFPSLSYFPSWELVMDELRDYRFYEADMIHLNSQAVDFIWKRFSDTFFSAETLELMKEIDRINKACRHRPFHPGSGEHRKFMAEILKSLDGLAEKYPFIDFSHEKEMLSGKIRPET